MQLEKIKLSGFKSFVDPTTIPINGNLTAIVGPNGCGKSNIIDAIRWVMGESSAKHLRGGSMADVIFNGSSGRKPVSTATVELVFDNTVQKLGGALAQYDTISIKRQVSRDGSSVYAFNGKTCRRKDVTDLFLGTGLGARSYAIIEQGTISRMVESKPEDLRIHIEEAAGISKYKERRQETETRMRNTRENLERLTDVRDEVDKQLNSLQKQAAKAEQYTQLKQQERTTKLELLAMRWDAYQQTSTQLQQKLQAVAAEHNQVFSEAKTVEQTILTQRAAHKTLQTEHEQRQGHFYQVSAEVGQLEQAIRHNEKDHEQTLLEITRLEQHSAQALQELQADQEGLEEINSELLLLETTIASAKQQETSCLATQQQLLQQQASWQQQWDQHRTENAKHKEQAEVQRVKIAQYEQQNRQLNSRLDKLHTERDELKNSRLAEEKLQLEEQLEQVELQQAELQAELHIILQQLEQQQALRKESQALLQSHQATLHTVMGKITSLELLQQHAMGKDNQKLLPWLKKMQISDRQRLAEFIEVEAGWETAVETILGDCLEAVCVTELDNLLPGLAELNEQSLTLFETPLNSVMSAANAKDKPALLALLPKIKAPWSLQSLLAGIYCAPDIAGARALLPQLQAHESIITPDGTWLGTQWVKVIRAKDAKHGVLQREQQLRQLKQQQTELQAEITILIEQLETIDAILKSAAVQRDTLQQQEKAHAAAAAHERSQLQVCAAKMQQQSHRLQQLSGEIDDTLAETQEISETVSQADLTLTTAATALESLTLQQQTLEQARQLLQQQQASAEQALQDARRDVQQQLAQRESLRASENLTTKQIERLKLQHQQAVERHAQLQQKLQALLLPLDDERLDLEALTLKKQRLDQELREQRQLVQQTEQGVTEWAEKHVKLQQALEKHKQQLDKIRFEQQECDVRQQTVTEQLQELEADVTVVLQALVQNVEATEAVWKARLEKLTAQITNLGAINLTAINEYQAQAERLNFLNEQHADLITALETLTQAINQIDKESRQRFKETFDKINSGLQLKFPKLFGGGKAYLELTNEDILEAGVNIIAQPPGKRNSSIHLLSGGEKALTAVALVFAIFELNPAPFCLLDEVDAPLDDANVGRFSQMVAEMSETVQFLYISHNKATMEIAKQLAGVTMKEPGVSRMVAVDIEESLSLAEN
ncbi:MAG: chromosome segregation protein SMC [Methylococcaceae bacterium]|nr:chromosome segregation protein SMC [Methylococcaceae bacterium]